MPEVRTTRRLAAILAADVVGYSRMMGADEAGTLTALKRHREAIFNPAVVQHSGRVVKLIGDGTLVEFASVVDAVSCALAIQRAVASDGAADPRIVLRIGVNLGDVIIEGDDIYGDGVNVAARLEPLAEPGGVCVASIVNESVGTRIDVKFQDGGAVQVKNIDRPIRVWKWHPRDGAPPQRPVTTTEPTAKAETPSIAVLPFDNMSGDAEQEYFSDGITEDIITDLSKVGGLLVIARNSSFAYKGKAVDIRNVGRELGVRSVLEGSIRRAGNRVRITAQLIDAATGAHLWAERYDRDLTDIFAVQDEVTQQIVAALKVTLSPGERATLRSDTTVDPEAYDLVLRARRLLVTPTKNREVFERSLQMLKRALEIDPDFSDTYSALAMAYNLDFQNRWSDEADKALDRALEYAELAVAKDPASTLGHTMACMAYTFHRDLDRAKIEVDKALAISPNLAIGHNARGVVALYSGDPAAAIPEIEQAIRLDPGFSQQYLHFLGCAHLLHGNYETAATYFRERILLAPETDFTRAFLVSALGLLDRIDEGRAVWRELMTINPEYSFDAHMARLPFRRPQDTALIREGFDKASRPD